MNILAIETATNVCSVAVSSRGKIIEENIQEQFAHAERLLNMIQQVLMMAETSPSDLNAIAVSIGPGSFTGLRIGLSAAKGLAYALDKPLIGVPTLESLAAIAVEDESVEEDDTVLSLLDARRDEVYCQLFQYHAGHLKAKQAACAMSMNDLTDYTRGSKVFVTGDAVGKVMEQSANLNHHMVPVKEQLRRCNASAIARLGIAGLTRGELANPATIEPMYIKEFRTTTPNKTSV